MPAGVEDCHSAMLALNDGAVRASELYGEPTLNAEDVVAAIFDGDQIQIDLQPKIDLRKGSICGAEAIPRWHHPTRGKVCDLQFVPLFEKFGAADMLFQIVIDRVAAVQQVLMGGGVSLPISICASAASLTHVNAPERIYARVQRHKVPSAMFCIEVGVTRGGDSVALAVNLCRLHAMGFRLLIDDCGTKTSNIHQLANAPFDELRIESGLVRQMLTNGPATHAVEHWMRCAHAFGMTATAKDVETSTQASQLKALGCDIAQGPAFHKSLPPESYIKLVRSLDLPQVIPEAKKLSAETL
ncbi:EAL domain-containing protein [Pandoraea iniqua]|nr:EAL domain-containing protein [Pandoraea iniqua]